jgi:hypothetical protein
MGVEMYVNYLGVGGAADADENAELGVVGTL